MVHLSGKAQRSTDSPCCRFFSAASKKEGFAMLFITHDLELARKVADRIIVMQHGAVVEQGSSHRIFTQPCCCHTKDLLAAAFGHSH
ncbi:MAG: hypothetical protein AB1796_00040 [Bacillota bacterium]